jgi:hypothetical protein
VAISLTVFGHCPSLSSFVKKKCFGDWICLHHQVKVGERGAYCSGSLWAGLHHWTFFNFYVFFLTFNRPVISTGHMTDCCVKHIKHTRRIWRWTLKEESWNVCNARTSDEAKMPCILLTTLLMRGSISEKFPGWVAHVTWASYLYFPHM